MPYVRFTIILVLVCIIGCFTACTQPTYTQTSGLADPVNTHPSYFYVRNLWDVLGDNFTLPDETPENPYVRKQINWYVSHPEYLNYLATQAKPYLYYIYQQVKRRKLPAELVLLPMVESNYDPFIYSRVGAAGLWQMMPGTASGFGLKIDWWYDGRRDIVASTNAALDYLSYLSNFFNGNWLLAIAAYDAGEGAVENAVQRNAKLGKSTYFWQLPLPEETKRYIPKLLALATIIKHPYEYPIDLPFIPDSPSLASVDVGSQIDLARAAKMARIKLQELSKLNPGFNRWATDPDGPHTLLLPIDKVAHFQVELEKLPKYKRVTWIRYKIQAGDTLIMIAEKFKTDEKLLRKVNRLKNNQIQVGHVLLIPTSTSKLTKIVLKSEQHYLSSPHKLPEIHYIDYTVKRGDTLNSIAKKYNVETAQIRFWNGIKYRATLAPGKRLIIWPPRRKSGTPAPIRLIHYKVRPGDSLSTIAQHFYTSTKTLRRINNLKSNAIKVDSTLKIPAITLHYVKHYNMTARYQFKKITYHVKAGDTLSTIAQRNHVTVKDLTHWNKIAKARQLKLNQILVIYKTETIHKKHKPHKTHRVKHYHAKKHKRQVNILNNYFTKHTPKKIVYHVKDGDTISTIAQRFNVKPANIKRWNRIKNPNNLKVNQLLVLYR